VIRAFLAVELSEDLRAKLATVQQELKHRIKPAMKRDTRISWTQPASIHLTLKFLGNMDEKIIDSLRLSVEGAIGSCLAVSVPLDRLGAFPRPQSPRVLWVGPSENWEHGAEAKRLAEIHRAIERACEDLSFLRETKPFSPHLTLARIKGGERNVGMALAREGVLDRPLSMGSLAVGSVVLMKSELKPTGSVYTKQWEVWLQG
jgi:RNA 2',3'-cyclic 3'-phosphodiesterase